MTFASCWPKNQRGIDAYPKECAPMAAVTKQMHRAWSMTSEKEDFGGVDRHLKYFAAYANGWGKAGVNAHLWDEILKSKPSIQITNAWCSLERRGLRTMRSSRSIPDLKCWITSYSPSRTRHPKRSQRGRPSSLGCGPLRKVSTVELGILNGKNALGTCFGRHPTKHIHSNTAKGSMFYVLNH